MSMRYGTFIEKWRLGSPDLEFDCFNVDAVLTALGFERGIKDVLRGDSDEAEPTDEATE
jgi:hypothetical protein